MKFDIRKNELEPITEIVFSNTSSIVQNDKTSVYIISGSNEIAVGFHDMPNLVEALKKANELWAPKTAIRGAGHRGIAD